MATDIANSPKAVAGTSSSIYRARAMALCGFTTQDLAEYSNDFIGAGNATDLAPGWFRDEAAGGSITYPGTTFSGGIVGAYAETANSTCFIRHAYGILSRAPTTTKWYVGGRACMISAAAATSTVFFGIQNSTDSGAPNKTVSIGVFGASDPAKMQLQYDGNKTGTFVDMLVAKDTNMHIYELWCNGDGKFSAALDFGATFSVTPSAAPATASIGFFAGSGSGGTQQILVVDNVYGLTVRSTASGS